MKTVIMAGGYGKRISSISTNIPKPMIKINNIPILEHEIVCLKEQGFTDIIITVSHLGSVIMDYFGDGSGISAATKEPFNVQIQYYNEEVPLGNAGALFKLRNQFTEDFLLLNADTMFNVDFNRMVRYHKNKQGLVTLFTHPNNHPYDSGLLIASSDNAVESWLTKEEQRFGFYKNRVNAGLHIINPKVLDMALHRITMSDGSPLTIEMIGEIDPISKKPIKIDLDRQILRPLSGTRQMFCYDSSEYVKDMGTPERLYAVEADDKAGKIKNRNLQKKQKAIFLDRDGTINHYVGFLRDINDFKLLPNVGEAIKRINASDYLCIVVTNQPVIARGEVTWEELEMIHNKMETLLGKEGAYLDGIYFCPHHPHKGYPNERKELKYDCNCRKPKPGMLIKASQDFNIDLSQSWMIGDRKEDIQAGQNAGCKTVFLCGDENQNSAQNLDFGQNITVKNLLNFVEQYFLC